MLRRSSNRMFLVNALMSIAREDIRELRKENEKLTRQIENLQKQAQKQQLRIQQLEDEQAHEQVRLFLGEHVDKLNSKFQSLIFRNPKFTEDVYTKYGTVDWDIVPD